MSETTSDPVLENDAPLPAEEPQVGEAQPTPTPETKPESAKQEEDWREKRIRQLTARHHAESQRAQQLEQQLEAIRKQQPQQPAPEQKPQGQPDLERLANERAEQILYQKNVGRVLADGSTKYGDVEFNVACNTLADMGANESPHFMRNIVELEDASGVLNHLGRNPTAAHAIINMPQGQQMRALARLEATLSAPAPAGPPPKPVSRVPAPITPVTGVENLDVSLEPDAEKEPAKWMAWAAKRVGTRR